MPWPVFVYSYLEMIGNFYIEAGSKYMGKYRERFTEEHRGDINRLNAISLPEHVESDEFAQLFRRNKYRLTVSESSFYQLMQFLEGRELEGGSVILKILTQFMAIYPITRAQNDRTSLSAMLARAKMDEDYPGEDEGIPGHNPGSAFKDQEPGSVVLAKLKLGPLPIEPTLLDDVLAELAEDDKRDPPVDGKASLVQEYQQLIKTEDSEENIPNRNDIPLPPSTARDVMMEVHKVKENRDRYKIDAQTGGVAAGISVIMFTFHNTHGTVTCVDISPDNNLIAIGTDLSYIRVWNVEGKMLPSGLEGVPPATSRRLIGHSGPIYNLHFSPGIDSRTKEDPDPTRAIDTKPDYLLSCSGDKTIRLWDLELWQCLVVYKAHMGPVWDVQWGPFGYYFASSSQDKTARIWNSENIGNIRMLAGHDQDVDHICWHPNNMYVFTVSLDKTVRMWLITNGAAVRMFTGHSGNPSALACSPNGKILASGDDAGIIILWDIHSGRLMKRMRGHGPGGIFSISWSVESNILISGGLDGTVRVWDANKPADAPGQGRQVHEGGAGIKIDAAKKKRKENVVTADQLGAFPTKKSPVYKVKFTRMNLAIAAGAYLP